MNKLLTVEEKAYKVIAALDLVKIVPAVAGRARAIAATKRGVVDENITPGSVLNLLRKSYRDKQDRTHICKVRSSSFCSA